jgi:hypothetical protein
VAEKSRNKPPPPSEQESKTAVEWRHATADLLGKIQQQYGFAAAKRIVSQALRTIQPKKLRRKSGPHQATKQFKAEWEATKSRQIAFLRASVAELNVWIERLRENIRQGKTDLGAPITPELVRAICDYIAGLEERCIAITRLA